MDKSKMKEIRKHVRSAELISQAKNLLEDNGYYVHSIYHVDDVTRMFDCTDTQAMQILELAIDNDGTANQIYENMIYFAEDMGLKEKEN